MGSERLELEVDEGVVRALDYIREQMADDTNRTPNRADAVTKAVAIAYHLLKDATDGNQVLVKRGDTLRPLTL